MSESPGFTTDSTIVGPSAREVDRRDDRLRRALMWVGIVAGIVFIVAVVFFSGFALGRGSGGYHRWHHGYQGQMGPGGESNGCPMMRNGGMGRGGMMGPGMEPDDMGPGMMRPGQAPTSTSPGPAQR